MRVLHVIPSVSAARGGPSVVVQQLADGLAREGVEVSVATTDDDGPGRLRRESDSRDGVLYHFFPRQARLYTISLPMSRWLWEHLPEFDLVHFHALFSYPSDSGAWLAGKRRIPYIVRPLGVLNRWGMEQRRPLLKKLAFQFLVRKLIERAAAIHYTSARERDEAETLGFQSTNRVIIPNPVAVGDHAGRFRGTFRMRYPQLAGKRLILFLSRLDEKKGLDLLMPAFAKVAAALPDAVLVIAGSGAPRFESSIKALAQRHGIFDRVFWTGHLSGDLKAGAFCDADVFVLPSYSENFGIAPVEAMAFGVPVVISDQVGIHGEVSEAGAGEITPCDAGPIAGAIIRLLASPVFRAEMGARGKTLALARYSTQAVVRQLVRAYEDVLSSGGSFQ